MICKPTVSPVEVGGFLVLWLSMVISGIVMLVV